MMKNEKNFIKYRRDKNRKERQHIQMIKTITKQNKDDGGNSKQKQCDKNGRYNTRK